MISDYFTKWTEAIPTTDKTASTVASSLLKVCDMKLSYIYMLGNYDTVLTLYLVRLI